MFNKINYYECIHTSFFNVNENFVNEYNKWDKINKEGYLAIIGHTPVLNKRGFIYDEGENYLNIDGGCSFYSLGYFDYDKVPLVEVKDGYLKIITFNNNNEIICGNYVTDREIKPFSDTELEEERKHLNKGLVLKRLKKFEDDIIGYEEHV